jgi:hypothetical protein
MGCARRFRPTYAWGERGAPVDSLWRGYDAEFFGTASHRSAGVTVAKKLLLCKGHVPGVVPFWL